MRLRIYLGLALTLLGIYAGTRKAAPAKGNGDTVTASDYTPIPPHHP